MDRESLSEDESAARIECALGEPDAWLATIREAVSEISDEEAVPIITCVRALVFRISVELSVLDVPPLKHFEFR